MVAWNWIDCGFANAVHDEQLNIHGGRAGLRDQGLLDSALARPQNLAAYENPDAAALAASYAFGIARNHAFVDGNKRTALVVSETFLIDNSFGLTASDAELAVLFQHLAAGDVSESELADWFRERISTS